MPGTEPLRDWLARLGCIHVHTTVVQEDHSVDRSVVVTNMVMDRNLLDEWMMVTQVHDGPSQEIRRG